MTEQDEVVSYGVGWGRAEFECIDCGFKYVHPGGSTLPPCPRYEELTHARSGWRLAEVTELQERAD